MVTGGSCETVKRPAYDVIADRRMGERRSLPRVNNVSGKAARREAASLLATADRRMSKQRGQAACQPCRRPHEEPVETQTHSDQLAEDKARQSALRPTEWRTRRNPSVRLVSNGESDRLPTPDRCPATEAINFQPPDGCPTGEGLITPTAGLDRGRRAKSTPSFRPALPAKDQRQLRFGSIPSWATGGERIILRSCPCNRDHAPRFLWSETLEKAKQHSHYHRPGAPVRGPAGPLPHIAAKVFTKVDGDSPRREPATSARATG